MEFDVYRAAKLAKLLLTEEEARELGSKISEMLQSIEILPNETLGENKDGYGVMELSKLRNDNVTNSLDIKDVLLNAPKSRAGCFVVPKVK